MFDSFIFKIKRTYITYVSGLELNGGNEGCVTEHLGILKNVSPNNFEKIPYIEWVFLLFCSFYA